MATPLTRIEFGFGTMNVKNLADIPRADVVACGRQAGRHTGLCVYQEIAEGDTKGQGGVDDADIREGLGEDFAYFHGGSENLITARKSRWRLATPDELPQGWKDAGYDVQGRVFLSKGIEGASPHRNLTYIVVVFLENEKFTLTVVSGTHFVSGVDSKKPPLKERQEARAAAHAGMTKFAADAHAAGMNHLFGLDSNWRLMPTVHPRQVWFVNATIDKIGWVPTPSSNYDLTLVTQERHPNPSDHDFFVANLAAVANATYGPVPPVERPTPPKPQPAPKPKPTRVESARVELAAALALLDAAVTGGRDGTVKAARDDLKGVLARLPKS